MTGGGYRTSSPVTAHGQQAGVVVAGGGGVEGADLLVKPFPQAIIDLTRDQRHLIHDCLLWLMGA